MLDADSYANLIVAVMSCFSSPPLPAATFARNRRPPRYAKRSLGQSRPRHRPRHLHKFPSQPLILTYTTPFCTRSHSSRNLPSGQPRFARFVFGCGSVSKYAVILEQSNKTSRIGTPGLPAKPPLPLGCRSQCPSLIGMYLGPVAIAV